VPLFTFCLFVPIDFHIVLQISMKFGMMVEEVPGDVLDTWRRNYIEAHANIHPHYFLRKKAIKIVQKYRDNKGIMKKPDCDNDRMAIRG
jgi:hypothetical protein